MKDLRELAYQLAVRNGIGHRFNNQTAGQDWVSGFLKRHPTLTLRTPESTSGARAMGFNKVSVDKFFLLLTKVVDKHKLTASQIYNCDETGITVNPKSNSKIIALKGKRQVGLLTSADRGETVTALLCMSASGAYMPPMLIFPRKRMQQEFEMGLPPGGWAEVHSSGWITLDTFFAWFKKFVTFSNASKTSPVLLILDGHSTHTKNLNVIDYARDNGVSMLCIPPHCSQRLQPLDVAFMNPLSRYYSEELRKWLRSNPGKVVTLFQISTIFGAAYIQCANMRTAISAFKATGIWPTDPSIFKEEDFLPADVTDIPVEIPPSQEAVLSPGEELIQGGEELIQGGEELIQEPSPNIPVKKCQSASSNDVDEVFCTDKEQTPAKKPRLNDGLSVPGCSHWVDGNQASQLGETSKFVVSPEVVMPIPKVKATTKRSNRKKGKTAILTESPYKRELMEAINEREEKNRIKQEKARMRLFKKENKSKSKETKGKNLKKLEKKKEQKNKDNDDSDDDDADCACLYCGEFYSKSVEGWVSCCRCKKWAHNSCAGIDSEDDEAVLLCELCDDKD